MILSVVNQKGGVGKSTIAQALGVGLGRMGKRALLVDLDQQGNLSYAMGGDASLPGAGEVLLGHVPIEEAIQPMGQADLLPSSAALVGADITIVQTGKEYRLREALGRIAGAYEYIILDTPPSMGILSVNALTASDRLLVPVQADIFSLQGVGQLRGTYEAVKRYTNPGVSVLGLVLTRFSERSVLSRAVRDMARDAAQALDTVVLDATIRESVVVREAQLNQQDIFSYAPRSKVAQDLEELLREVIEVG